MREYILILSRSHSTPIIHEIHSFRRDNYKVGYSRAEDGENERAREGIRQGGKVLRETCGAFFTSRRLKRRGEGMHFEWRKEGELWF